MPAVGLRLARLSPWLVRWKTAAAPRGPGKRWHSDSQGSSLKVTCCLHVSVSVWVWTCESNMHEWCFSLFLVVTDCTVLVSHVSTWKVMWFYIVGLLLLTNFCNICEEATGPPLEKKTLQNTTLSKIQTRRLNIRYKKSTKNDFFNQFKIGDYDY